MARLRPAPSFSLVPLLAVLALACQDSTAPEPSLPSVEGVPEEAGPEPQEPASLVDQTHWADGYVSAGQPEAASYTPTFSFNRTGGAIRITKPAGTTGRYLVKLTGLSAFLGTKSTVHVTGAGGYDIYCKPVRAYLVNDTLEVRCFQASTGAAVNAFFTVLVLRKSTKLAFAHAHQPTGTNYTPQTRGSWNPGGTIKVLRNAVGNYQVLFSGLDALVSASANGGHVQVNAVGKGKQHCKVGSWGGGGVSVLCYTQAGAAVDTKFNVIFFLPSDRLAYAWGDQPSIASYTPHPFYTTGGANSITRLATGVYTVRWPAMGSQITDGGHVQVTAYGSGNAQCKVTGWGSTSADVLCFAPNGMPVDTYYTVLLGS